MTESVASPRLLPARASTANISRRCPAYLLACHLLWTGSLPLANTARHAPTRKLAVPSLLFLAPSSHLASQCLSAIAPPALPCGACHLFLWLMDAALLYFHLHIPAATLHYLLLAFAALFTLSFLPAALHAASSLAPHLILNMLGSCGCNWLQPVCSRFLVPHVPVENDAEGRRQNEGGRAGE